MNKQAYTIGLVMRWVFVGTIVASYWLLVGSEILKARADEGDVFAWLFCNVITLPWSAAVLVSEPAPENEKMVLTLACISGALMNGLVFWFIVWRLTRGPRHRDAVARDYAEGQGGAVRDGRKGPRRG
jgi:hypothetical protein